MQFATVTNNNDKINACCTAYIRVHDYNIQCTE